MAWPEDDLDGLFLDDGVTASWTPSGGEAAEKTVLFDENREGLIDGDILAYATVMTVQAAEFTGVKKGDAVTVNGTDYTVSYLAQEERGLRDIHLTKVDE